MGNDVYPAFDFPDDISSLDKAKVERTLDRLWMLAEMSDDYSVTRQEQKRIEIYSRMHNLGEKIWQSIWITTW